MRWVGIAVVVVGAGCQGEPPGGVDDDERPPVNQGHQLIDFCCPRRLVWSGFELATADGEELGIIDGLGLYRGSTRFADSGGALVSLAYDGAGYGMVWERDAFVYLSRVDREGVVAPVELVRDVFADLSVTWNGSELALLESQRFARFDRDGQPIGEPVTIDVTPPLSGPLTWNGSGYTAIWEVGGDLYALELAADGAPLGDPSLLLAGFYDPQVVWNGTELAVLADDNPGAGAIGFVLFLRVDTTGQLLDDPVPVESFPCCARASFVALDDGYAVAGINELGAPLARLEPDGRLRDLTTVGSGREQHVSGVAFTGSEIGVIYGAIDTDGRGSYRFHFVDF